MLCVLAGAGEDPGGVSNAAAHESGCEPADPPGQQQHHQGQGHHRAQDATPQLQRLISKEYQARFIGEVSAVIPYQEGEGGWCSRPQATFLYLIFEALQKTREHHRAWGTGLKELPLLQLHVPSGHTVSIAMQFAGV